MDEPNRGPWIIAASIVLAAAMIVGAMAYFRFQDREACADWQETYRVVITHRDSADSKLAEKLYASRPEGCPIP